MPFVKANTALFEDTYIGWLRHIPSPNSNHIGEHERLKCNDVMSVLLQKLSSDLAPLIPV